MLRSDYGTENPSVATAQIAFRMNDQDTLAAEKSFVAIWTISRKCDSFCSSNMELNASMSMLTIENKKLVVSTKKD